MATIVSLGRLPDEAGFPQAGDLISRLGSLKRAFALIQRVTGSEEWDTIHRRRTEDLLVYLALSRFRKRPPFGHLPRRRPALPRRRCRRHRRGVPALPRRQGAPQRPVRASQRPRLARPASARLRGLRPGVPRRHRRGERPRTAPLLRQDLLPRLPDFDTDPHPALLRCAKLSLRSRELECDDAQSDHPPVLHRKETFLLPDHPLQAKFARLTRQEEQHGLLADTAAIGTRAGWRTRLQAAGWALRGHRLVKAPAADCAPPEA